MQHLNPSSSGPHRFDRNSGHAQALRALAKHYNALRSRAASVLASGHGRALTFGFSTVAMAAATPSMPAPGDDAQSSKPPARIRSWQDFGHEKRRATDTFIVINCAAFALQWLSQDLLTFWGAKVNALIAAGQWWRLISPAFLHSSFFHLVVNCHALHSIGPQLELVSGSARLAAVYITSAFTGTLASYLFTPSPSLGASGALFGCGAALAVFYYRHKEVLQQHSDSMLRNLGITVAINLGYSLLAKNVDNWGHLGGALGGALLGWLLGPHLVRSQEGRFVDRPPVKWLAYKESPVLAGQGTAAVAVRKSGKVSKSGRHVAAGAAAGGEAVGHHRRGGSRHSGGAGGTGEGGTGGSGRPQMPGEGGDLTGPLALSSHGVTHSHSLGAPVLQPRERQGRWLLQWRREHGGRLQTE